MQEVIDLSKPIGIIGGGQLARMLSIAAAKLGIECYIYDPDINCPASTVCKAIMVGDFSDENALRDFAKSVSVITFEFENIDITVIDKISQLVPILPNANALRVSQDRILEKTFINNCGIATAPWFPVSTIDELHLAIEKLGLPLVLKTTRLGYDGKGQRILHNENDCATAFLKLEPKPLIAEKLINFSKEISVIVARNSKGDTVYYEPSENQHKDGILDLVRVPAAIKPAVNHDARSFAIEIAKNLDIVGLICIEMFVTADNEILINEIAVRPHNSGHWTIDACDISQFELHIRAITGLPLILPQRYNDAMMKNLIGQFGLDFGKTCLQKTGYICHFYGKKQARPGRKMGHITRLYRLWSLDASEVF